MMKSVSRSAKRIHVFRHVADLSDCKHTKSMI